MQAPPKPLIPNAKPVRSCDSLADVALPNTTIESAGADANNPDICRVVAIATHPPADDKVRIWIAIPRSNWNGRFLGTGGGGFSGGSPNGVNQPVALGFAAGATDTGHVGGSASFALDTNGQLNWQAIRNFAHVGIHEMTVTGKALTEAMYGMAPRYSYFNGCSTGGRQGLMEAQRYPQDYDGIVAAAPAINWTHLMMQSFWGSMLMNAASNPIPSCKLAAATAAAVAACDAIDGVKDGVLEDPARCTYDPKPLIGTSAGDCGAFTQADADIIRKLWEGPRRDDGGPLWHGPPRGADLNALAASRGTPLAPQAFGFSVDWLRYFITQNPQFDWTTVTPAAYQAFWDRSVRAIRHRHRHRQSRSQRVPRSRRQDDHLARRGRCAHYRRQDDRLLQTRAAADGRRKTDVGLRAVFSRPRRQSLRRRPRPPAHRRSRRTRVVGRNRQGAGHADRRAARSVGRRHPLATAVPVPACCEISGDGQDGRRAKFRLQRRVPGPAGPNAGSSGVPGAGRSIMTTRQLVERLGLTMLALSSTVVLPARQAAAIPDSLFEGLSWRPIGPMRGGRTCAVAGHRAHPFTFYIGVCNGGVWKTTDAGTTWLPIFDDQPTQSIGALAIAPSNPNIIYVGSGEGLHRPDLSVGNGLYRSADAGRRGHISVCAMRNRFPRSPSTRAIPIACSSRCSVIRTVRTASAASTGRRTAAGRSHRSSPAAKTSGRETWTSTHRTWTSSIRRSGKIARARGRTRRGAGRAAACSNRPTAATPGGH